MQGFTKKRDCYWVSITGGWLKADILDAKPILLKIQAVYYGGNTQLSHCFD